jgi:uncharacterized protein (TIGR02611 family)
MNRRPRGSGDDEGVHLNDSLTPETPDDHNITLDADDDGWEWRRRIRSNPRTHLIYRSVVGVVGVVIVVIGLILVPLPGQGWLVVILGLAILASEFEWAQRLLHLVKSTLKAWTEWLMRQPWWTRGLVLLFTVAVVATVFWLLFLISGVPGYLPDVVENWLKKVPGLGP